MTDMENTKVICNAELHEYARELRDQGKHDLLYDVADKCYHHANDKMGVAHDELQQPSMAMNDDALYDSVMHNCMAGARHAALAGYHDHDDVGHHGGKHHSGLGHEHDMGHYGKHSDMGYGRSRHSGRGSHGGAQMEHVADPHEMARKVIIAQKMHDMPKSAEARNARKKGISWHMQADADQVRVTRSRVGGSTTCYSYACPTEQSFVKLVRATQRERDNVLRKGHF